MKEKNNRNTKYKMENRKKKIQYYEIQILIKTNGMLVLKV